MTDPPAVQLRPPPPAVLRVVNPVLRRLLTSPLAERLPAPMAVLQFSGRRSGRAYAIPVGVHPLPEQTVVFTEARWRRNFADGHELAVVRGGSRRSGRGVLVEDPETVTDALLDAVRLVGARNLALRTSPGHTITREDLHRLGRSMVRLHLAE